MYWLILTAIAVAYFPIKAIYAKKRNEYWRTHRWWHDGGFDTYDEYRRASDAERKARAARVVKPDYQREPYDYALREVVMYMILWSLIWWGMWLFRADILSVIAH